MKKSRAKSILISRTKGLVLVGCALLIVQGVQAASNPVIPDDYIAKHRDSTIRNWQSHIAKSPACAKFSERYWTEGRKFPSAASGAFVNTMQRIKKAATQANCVVEAPKS